MILLVLMINVLVCIKCSYMYRLLINMHPIQSDIYEFVMNTKQLELDLGL